MRKLSELWFCAICFCFSALLLVLSLLGAVRLAALSDEASDLEQEVRKLKIENQTMSVEYETLLRLDEIERFAAEDLGMQHCSPGQMVFANMGDTER